MQTSESPRTIEPWKLELIRERARRMRFQAADIDDAVQEIAIELLDFHYDPNVSHTATETTVLTQLIDNRLNMRRRAESRYLKRLEKLHDDHRPAIRTTVDEPDERREPAYDENPGAVLDVRDAIDSLDAPEREVCQLLGEGHSISDIARQLGCSQTTVRNHVEKIRRRLIQLGVQLWIVSDGEAQGSVAIGQPILLTAPHAAALCGKSLRTWRTWDAAGFIPQPVRIGRSTFWRADELREWVKAGCPKRPVWEVLRAET